MLIVFASCAAVPGAILRRTCAWRIASGIRRRSRAATTVFVVRGLSNPFNLYLFTPFIRVSGAKNFRGKGQPRGLPLRQNRESTMLLVPLGSRQQHQELPQQINKRQPEPWVGLPSPTHGPTQIFAPTERYIYRAMAIESLLLRRSGMGTRHWFNPLQMPDESPINPR